MTPMTSLRIDFAPGSVRRTFFRTPPAVWLLAALGVALCLAAAFALLNLSREKNARQLELREVQSALSQRAEHRIAPKKLTIAEGQAAAVNAIIAQLNLPWGAVLDALEEGTPASVALLAIEPDAKKHVIKVMAETKSGEEMIAYVEQLKKQAFFDDVMLTKHEVNDQDPNRPIRFQLEAQWAGGA